MRFPLSEASHLKIFNGADELLQSWMLRRRSPLQLWEAKHVDCGTADKLVGTKTRSSESRRRRRRITHEAVRRRCVWRSESESIGRHQRGGIARPAEGTLGCRQRCDSAVGTYLLERVENHPAALFGSVRASPSSSEVATSRCPAAFRAKYGQLHIITSVLSDFPVQHADLWGGM